MSKFIGLNIGCGACKLDNYINVDINIKHKPDVVFNIFKPFPIPDNSFGQVLLLHVIEHVPATLHANVLLECRRILKDDGFILIAYPEFIKCATNYIENKFGKRDFWAATIYGRQLTHDDYHVALMNTHDFIPLLEAIGYRDIVDKPEPYPLEGHNTIVKAYKGTSALTREDIIRDEIYDGRKKWD